MKTNYNYTLKCYNMPFSDLIKINALFINNTDFDKIKNETSCQNNVYIEIKQKIMEIKGINDIEPGCIGMGFLFRRMIKYGEGSPEDISFNVLDNNIALTNKLKYLKLIVTMRNKREQLIKLEDAVLINIMKKQFVGTPINKNHLFYIDHEEIEFILEVKDFWNESNDSKGNEAYFEKYGFLSNETEIELISNTPNFKIHITNKPNPTIIKKIPSFEELGIGGLDNEINHIFHRILTTRLYPPSYIKKFGINHVKGILLYGPPGTGKTLIARTLAKILNVREFKVINGPELFDKYVGETEKKIREIFSDAEEDEKENGDNSGLHIIVFDEIDSLCKKRGVVNSETGVHDNAVNQLLTKIDGVDALNNIIVIGMTNRRDLLDEAILRPGRLELHIEIGLPTEKGREQIFNVYLKKIKENKLLNDDVDINHLSKITKNFTGADIEAMVKLSVANVLFKGANNISKNIVNNNIQKLSMKNFMDAFNEIQPMFGIHHTELKNYIKYGIINYGTNFEIMKNHIMESVNHLKKSKSINLLSILLEGDSGSGKTALSSFISKESNIPFIKIISPDLLVRFNEKGKYNIIYSIFEDAYKSPFSIIILDNIEQLIEYVKIGPAFNNLLLQTLIVYIKKIPPKKNTKILIIGTTSKRKEMENFGIIDAFDKVIHIPNLNKSEITKILSDYNSPNVEIEKIISFVKEIPIKKLLNLIDNALQENNSLTFQNFKDLYNEYK